MVRAVTLLSILSIFLFSFDYSKCAKKLQDSFVYIDGMTTIPIANGKTLFISYNPVKFRSAKVLKHDPFLGIYLLEYPHNKKPIEFGDNKAKEMVAVYKDGFEAGEISKVPLGFSWGKLSFDPTSSGVLSDICYRVYGVINKGGFLDHIKIGRFLSNTPIAYSYLGFIPTRSGSNLIVTLSDPFFENNPFLEGDVILSIDNIDVKSVDEFYEVSAYKPVDSNISVKILRDGVVSEKIVKSALLSSRGLLDGNFLDRFGIVLDGDMRVESVANPAFGFEQLKRGDRIVAINRVEVNSMDDIKRVLSKITTNDIKMLTERDNFMFFISLKGRRSY